MRKHLLLAVITFIRGRLQGRFLKPCRGYALLGRLAQLQAYRSVQRILLPLLLRIRLWKPAWYKDLPCLCWWNKGWLWPLLTSYGGTSEVCSGQREDNVLSRSNGKISIWFQTAHLFLTARSGGLHTLECWAYEKSKGQMYGFCLLAGEWFKPCYLMVKYRLFRQVERSALLCKAFLRSMPYLLRRYR